MQEAVRGAGEATGTGAVIRPARAATRGWALRMTHGAQVLKGTGNGLAELLPEFRRALVHWPVVGEI